ncbi:hypothetical protein EYD10_17201 [Varanus komodoensis]|nr:hypothetical protein EYD10_17201 [Varanus komodoensis]
MTHNVMMRFHNTQPHSATDGAQKQPFGCPEAALPLARPLAERRHEQAEAERAPWERASRIQQDFHPGEAV